MKRNDIIQKLMKEGFSEKTLVGFSDKQIMSLAERVLGEQEDKVGINKEPATPAKPAQPAEPAKGERTVYNIGKGTTSDINKLNSMAKETGVEIKKEATESETKGNVCKKCGKKICECGKGAMDEKLTQKQSKNLDKNHNGKIDAQDFKILKGQKKDVKEEKPSAGLSKEKKSEVVKKAKKGEDIGKKGKGFEKIEKKAKESGAKDPKAVAAAAMWKNIKREGIEVKEWVNSLAESNYHPLTSKGEIMELITKKLEEQKTAPSKPDKDAPVREKPKTKPGEKPKKEDPFEPKHTPKPKAMGEENKPLPDFMKFKNVGIKFRDEK